MSGDGWRETRPSLEEVEKALADWDIDLKCPACGSEDIGYMREEGGVYGLPRVTERGRPESYKPVLLMTCTRCGYVMQFVTQFLMETRDG